MFNFAIGFVCSFLVILLIVRNTHMRSSRFLDHDLQGVQKNHAYAVPRIGGVGIAFALVATVAAQTLVFAVPLAESAMLLLCAIPVFAGGVIEDFTKRVSPRARLICALVSALAACLVMHSIVSRVDLPLVDQWLRVAPIGIAITMLAVAGLTNAINIIDGFNGLASVVAIFIFASIAYVAHEVNDWFIMSMALTMIGAIAAFVFWNYSVPSVFLGDGSAYLIGFMMAELLVLLIARHPNVSAWYAMIVAIYPIFETLFSIYRRRIVRGRSAGDPDALHLHTLVFRRVVGQCLDGRNVRERTRRNSHMSVYLWAVGLVGVLPGTFFWNKPIGIAGAAVFFVILYVWLYVSIVRFNTPRWLLFFSISSALIAPPRTEQTRQR
ncbi:Undecaprenyl-phosphate N-acetylglucosaminyl 1-phosphate transferase [Candidatus Burkholderia humilis]|nr:Undecaprenyl-phosphate N-acetylglucosaminyl 1-phosphate transferase [Candidatus Burkholderia humilis]